MSLSHPGLLLLLARVARQPKLTSMSADAHSLVRVSEAACYVSRLHAAAGAKILTLGVQVEPVAGRRWRRTQVWPRASGDTCGD